MTDFEDVAAFARQHSACGGITPNATTQRGGGYLLTVRCACGATLDRWVTAEEALRPLPRAVSTAAPRRPAVSPELEVVLQEALAAEEVAAAEPVAPADDVVDLQAALRDALADDEAATPAVAPAPAALPALPLPAPSPAGPPKPVASVDLQAALREALAADEPALSGAPATSSPVRARPAAIDHGAWRTNAPLRPATPPPARPFWLITLGLSAVALGLAIWIGLDGQPGTGPAPPAVAVATPSPSAPATSTVEIVASLRHLQASATPGATYAVYSSRVLFAKADLDRFLATEAPAGVKTQAREILDVHALASAAWRARETEQSELWESVGESSAVTLCPTVQRLVDAAAPSDKQSRAHARGVAVANAIPLLWECAAARLAMLEPPG